jgi:uncharacterized membrane protein YkoI
MKKTITILTATMLSLIFVILSHAGELPKGITLTEAINIAIEKKSGEVIKAELEDGIYEIKIKRVKGETEKIYLDAATGQPVKKVAVSLSEATNIALSKVAGEVLKVEFERSKYEIKIRSTDGVLKEVYVDARSGNIIKIKEKKRKR